MQAFEEWLLLEGAAVDRAFVFAQEVEVGSIAGIMRWALEARKKEMR